MSTKVLLVDDHALARKGLGILVSSLSDTEVIGEAANGEDAILLAEKLRPDVVIMDVTMKSGDGISTTREILRKFPECHVLGLSMHESEHVVRQMVRAGAKGFVAKSASIEEIIKGIHTVGSGERFFSSNFNIELIETEAGENETTDNRLELLSSREREVLQLVAGGKSSKQIAFELEISEKTVGFHRQRLMQKLQLHSIAELTKYAIQEGLIPPVVSRI